MKNNAQAEFAATALMPNFPAIVVAGGQALRQIQDDNPTRSQKTRRACLTDDFAAAIAAEVSGVKVIDSGGGDKWLLFPDVALVRVKRATPALVVRNRRTDRHESFLANEELPGIGAALPRFELCYVPNNSTTDFKRVVLTQRDADGVKLMMDLPWGTAASTGVARLEFELPESKVRPKESARIARREARDA